MAAKKEPEQSPGQAMVAAIVAEMLEAGVEPDAKEHALLTAARELVDRMADLQLLIATDGKRSISETGIVRLHPGIAEHRQLAATLPKVLSGIVVGDTMGGTVKNPQKVRAANARWANRDALRENQARAAGL